MKQPTWLLCPKCGCDRFTVEGDSEAVFFDCIRCGTTLQGTVSDLKVVENNRGWKGSPLSKFPEVRA